MLSDLRAPDGEAPPVSSVYAPFKVQFAGRSVHGLGFLCPGRSSRDPPGSQTTIPPCIFQAMRFSALGLRLGATVCPGGRSRFQRLWLSWWEAQVGF